MAMWNPWRGCHRCSEGCRYCYIHKGDAKRGVDAEQIVRTKGFDAAVQVKRDGAYRMKGGQTVCLCFSSNLPMKYTREQRLDIAKRIYDGELTVEEAAVKYGLNPSSVKVYLRLYRVETGLPPRMRRKKTGNVIQPIEDSKDSSLKEYESMSKEELIDALVMARINESRLKKGYSVKGSVVEKKYLPIDGGNIK